LIRAARFAGRFGMTIDPATEAAAVALAPTVATVSGERVRDELQRILERLGILRVILPEVAALRGVPQSKAIPGDALDHSLAAVDAAPPNVRLAALLHDVGKATTLENGHFIGHDRVGAELAAQVLHRLRLPTAVAGRIVGAIRHHKYDYDSDWPDAAVRRFIRRTAQVDRRLLFDLRRADNAASGVGDAGAPNQAELETRIIEQLAAEPDLLMHRRLAIDGHDLQAELGMAPGPELGAVLDRLTEAVLDDPSLNRREALLELARQR
jgi:putative nucleotidyltransferase with HDIG domain